jgi:hypothetical protein
MSGKAMARLGGRVKALRPATRNSIPPDTGNLGYPWQDGELLYAEDLNEAIAGRLAITGGTIATLNISNLPNAQPDGSPPVGAVKGDLYNNGGFVCVAQ